VCLGGKQCRIDLEIFYYIGSPFFFTKFGRHIPVLLKIEMMLDILNEASPAFLRFSLPRIS